MVNGLQPGPPAYSTGAGFQLMGAVQSVSAIGQDQVPSHDHMDDAAMSGAEFEYGDEDASGEDVDAEGEEDTDFFAFQLPEKPQQEEEERQEPVSEEEEEGESDDEDDRAEAMVDSNKFNPSSPDKDDRGEEEDDEAVGDADSDDSVSQDESEEEEEAPWEDAEAEGEDDEDEEAAPSNLCMFCKQDEENDPSEDFEAFLACVRCTENAHQQCAREAAAMSEDNTPQYWKCPECFHTESEEEHEEDYENDEKEEDMVEVKPDSPAEGALQPAPELVVTEAPDDKPMSPVTPMEAASSDDGGRPLRKRKTPSVEPDDMVTSLRKRRRNQSDEASSLHEDGAENEVSAEVSRQQRALRLKATRPSPVTIEKKTRTSLVIKIEVRPGNLKEILSRRRRERRTRAPASASRPPKPPATPRNNPPMPAPTSAIPTPFTSDTYSQPYYSLYDRETDEMKGKPYGGILTEAEADTSKTIPLPEDRKRFDDAKQRAEDEWRARVLSMQAEAEVPIRRPKKSSDNASQIECIEFGGWEIDTWYAAPYPAEYSRNRVLYICQFCLKYMNSDYVAWRHKLKCPSKHPPGDEIYRDGKISFFEVDGRKNPVYCQNLCLLAKLFLGSKTLYYDVEPFLFYVLCEYDDCGYHFVGYFSKEKRSSSQNNVSCILTLPIHQRKGYGNLLIDFSYLLTKVEQKTGSPEKPLSDMGLVSYRNYWRLVLCRYFLDAMKNNGHKKEGLSIRKISDDTGMTPDDVVSALEGLRALVRDPQTKLYAFRVDVDYCRQYVDKWEAKKYYTIKPDRLVWSPYVMGRSNANNFELTPALNTTAPREGEEEAKVLEGPGTVGAESQPALNSEKQDSADPDGEIKKEPTEANGEDAGLEPVNSIEEKHIEDDEKVSAEDMVVTEAKETDSEEKTTGGPKTDGSKTEEPPAWTLPYRDIPVTRFEVFPPIPKSRRTDRSNQSAARTAPPRAPSSTSRSKRSGGSATAAAAATTVAAAATAAARRPAPPSKAKNASTTTSSSKKKTGGTGRGPGRWPKGTKKSDYGNADSGPGLPPGWKKGDSKGAASEEKPAVAARKDEDTADEKPAEDSVFVSTSVQVRGGSNNGENEDDQDASGDEVEVSMSMEVVMEEDVDAEGEDV